MKKNNYDVKKMISFSALLTILGIIISGPLGVYIVSLVQPQPAWVDVETFVQNYHPIQRLPFAGGFLLIFGFTLFISASTIIEATTRQKLYKILSLIFVTLFTVFIGTNYMFQLAYIPQILQTQPGIISVLSMFNPQSLAWVFEMFGYGFLGLSTWFIAGVFRGNKLLNTIRYLLILNGLMSIAGAIFTVINTNWLMATSGLISYGLWNLLILVIMVLVFIEIRQDSLNKEKK